MEPADHLTALRTESAALAAAVTGELDVDVPCCPGWSLAHLVHHVGEVHRFWTGTLQQGDGKRGPRAEVPPVDQVDVAWFEAGATGLAAALEVTDAAQPVWNWSGADQTAAWLFRRMAHETAVHRWDAESSTSPTGSGTRIASRLALDGVDELFEVFLPAAVAAYGEGDSRLDLGGSLLVQPEGGRPWRVELRPGACGIERADDPDATADAIVSGEPSDLLPLLWNRTSAADGTRVTGDGVVLDRWRSLPIFD